MTNPNSNLWLSDIFTIENMEYVFCIIRFSFENDLMSHITLEHTVTLPYECKDCDASFSKTHDLKRHIDLGHEFKIPEKM